MPYRDPVRQREFQNRWMKQRRLDWLAEHGPCVDCGTWDDLEVDHVDPATKVAHRVWSWSLVRREAELAKCVARCHSCHDEKSNEQSRRRRYCPHGHDTSITGRDDQYRCRQCRIETEYPARNEQRRKR